MEKDYNEAAEAHSIEKLVIDWAKVVELTRIIHGGLRFQPSAIVAVSRGGLIPGVLLSHLTGCRHLYELRCQQYADVTHERGQIKLDCSHEAYVALLNADTLVIEDIVDTGNTVQLIHSRFPNPTIAALVRKDKANDNYITKYAMLVKQNVWITFPWELSDVEYKSTLST